MDNFVFSMPYLVRVVDVNYGGHVANSAVLNFFQDARIAYLKSLGDYSELDVGSGCGIILPEAHVKYLAEMFLHDQLEIGVRISAVSRSSFTMQYQIERDGVVTAEGETVLVCFDYQLRKPQRMDKEFRQRIVDFEQLDLSDV